MRALASTLDPLGAARISRINRDMRFSRDREPYKTHISAGVDGYYVSLSAHGLYVGTGMYKPEPAVLAKFRAAIDRDAAGRSLDTIVKTLRRKGYEVGTHESPARRSLRGRPPADRSAAHEGHWGQADEAGAPA